MTIDQNKKGGKERGEKEDIPQWSVLVSSSLDINRYSTITYLNVHHMSMSSLSTDNIVT